MLTQVHNFMEVEYLPVMYPSLREQSNPPEFAERVISCPYLVSTTEFCIKVL
jgi:hypothetical protein